MIYSIPISKIFPHPQNPRMDVGDVSELAESIKVKGILQNLTVVPRDNETYTVIIGHRRLAAAKLAGLTEVPCAISDMSPQEQIATMLLENMQRNDLTLYEQAHGIQMMLDLGESIANISEKTGLSESTVRRRVKLLELDQDKFKASIDKGATIMDYAELEKIESIELRNSVLDKIGTSNFKWELQKAIEKEAAEKRKAVIISKLEKFATKVETSDGLQYIKTYLFSNNEEISVPEDAGTAKYYFYVSEYNYITLYKERTKEESAPSIDEKEQARRARFTELNEVSKRAYMLRRDFIKGLSNTWAKRFLGVIVEYNIRTSLTGFADYSAEDLGELLGIEIDEDFRNLNANIMSHPERHLLIATYCAMDGPGLGYFNYSNEHIENRKLDDVYDFLEHLGYEISDEEQQLRDGTHVLFTKAK